MDATNKAAQRAEAFGLVLPLRYLGAHRSVYQAVPGDPNCPLQPGSACDACGQGIMEVHTFKDANDRLFKTGCDCVYRYLPATHATAVKKEHRRLEREKSAKRAAARRAAHKRNTDEARAALQAFLDETHHILRTLPHPQDWAAKKGLTALDWAEWTLTRAGAAKLKVVLADAKAMVQQ